MSLESRIQSELMSAMRSRDEAALRGLRAIKSAIMLAKTSDKSGKKDELAPEEELKLLQKLAKQRRESMDIYKKEGRDDLVSVEKQELEVIEKFLPSQIDEKALELNLQTIIEKAGATTVADLGKVMGLASRELAGKADNKRISELARKLLSG